MSFWTIAAVRDALSLSGSEADVTFSEVSTDSRKIAEGGLFVALQGEHFDGHNYLNDVAARGARGAVVSRVPSNAPDSLIYFTVADTLIALGMLGQFYRRSLDVRLCAVTGSNGKTTTKEMIKAVLSTRYRVHATTGNLNNRIGTPLTLLATPSDAEIVIAELGTSLPGEIAILAEMSEPDAAVVTAISEEHLEGLGSLQGVLDEELSIIDALDEDSFAIVADEPSELPEAARTKHARILVAGWSDRADASLRGRDVRLDDNGEVHFEWNGFDVHVPLPGRHNARNALIALGVATEWQVEPRDAVEALRFLKPAKMRGEVHQYGELTVIADCYNANPASMSAAIDLLAAMPKHRRKIAVVGSMLEMGSASGEVHERAANEILGTDIDVIVATGEFVKPFAKHDDARVFSDEDPLDAFDLIRDRLQGNEIVLLKGSRGVALERLLPALEEYGSAPPPRGGRKAGGELAHRDAKTASTAEHSHD